MKNYAIVLGGLFLVLYMSLDFAFDVRDCRRIEALQGQLDSLTMRPTIKVVDSATAITYTQDSLAQARLDGLEARVDNMKTDLDSASAVTDWMKDLWKKGIRFVVNSDSYYDGR